MQIKDKSVNEERFLRMIEAMYGDDDSKLESKILDFDYCANLGIFLDLNKRFFISKIIINKMELTNATDLQRFTSVVWTKTQN